LINEKKIEITLVDYTGKEVINIFSGSATEGRTDISINLSNLSQGLYVYKIKLNNEIKYLKTQKL
jgi:hypothetical protein